ncbi:hypothetical protein PHLGIDRAFT_29976 [Phlebiopsis gigantea 11061_1 CR5-6]|uniref:DNA repair protein REV1 n=1 Tax=Phlebiopsis gigantea (strain 11061_1 CR5-6) TaxID=745531 RepID=A0A0C3PLS1_PHLG1|nr:hypothetical protein PHLGIDRAFT_29976 [Phlebiopsis gigantea 11061_1 CR5-6]
MSSDYWEEDDPEFLALLNNIVIPGETVQPHNVADDTSNNVDKIPAVAAPISRKRPRSPEPGPNEDLQDRTTLSLVDNGSQSTTYLKSHTYGASSFGGFGEYMQRKRAKLQIQNAEMDEEEGLAPKNRIFKGLQIYINGWTEPSVQDLRQLIIQYGGIYHAYLDKKSLVTHIITCSLTPAKVKEFQYMKVVRPEWLLKSVEAGMLLPWREFIFKTERRVEVSQGQKTAQQSLVSSSITSSARQSRDAPAPAHQAPVHITAPMNVPEEMMAPGYAADKSNIAAQRVMADPAWRAAHTSIAPDFIEDYYRNSRLHHLSTWKAELRNLVAEAQERAEDGLSASSKLLSDVYPDVGAVGKVFQQNMNGKGWMASDGVSMKGAQLVKKDKGKGKEKAVDPDDDRVIMHCDFDSFFVSAGLVERPHLRGKPVVVCHSQGAQGGQSSTSEIASASYEARKFGIRGGMSLQQARKLCPEIQTIPYEFQKYKQLSLQFYTILMAHADDLQAVSVDEALIDVTSSVRRIKEEILASQGEAEILQDPAKEFAEAIRAQVRKATGCEVSVGISYNIMLARLATRRAKPGGSYHLHGSDVGAFLEPLDIDDLHGFGHSAHQKAQEKLGTANLGELAKKSRAVLCDALGKGTGETLYNALQGVDHRKLDSDKPRKSVSCDINYGIRFDHNEQAETFVYQLAEEVSRRLNDIEMRGRSLTLKVLKRDPTAPVEAPKFMGHGLCESFTKQIQMAVPGGRATSDHKVIGEYAWKLLKSFAFDPTELRGIGIQVQKLEPASGNNEVQPGQARLPFKSVASPQKPKAGPSKVAEVPAIILQPPSQEILPAPAPPGSALPVTAHFDLPSFSQVDMSVFRELPEDVRRELEDEYKRRSATPDVAQAQEAVRAASIPVEPKVKFTVKGTNVKRITRQLAPRNRASISPKKKNVFNKPPPSTQVKIGAGELRKLGLDPAVFAVLPVDLQREQLAYARQKSTRGGPGRALGGKRKVLKPTWKPRPVEGNVIIPPPPPPKARFPVEPTLKQPGKAPGEKLHFSATDDVQTVIEAWVERFREHPPNAKDVQFFAKFLVHCTDGARSTDSGVQKAVAIMKWWLVLLRRDFAVWEHEDDDPFLVVMPGTSEYVGRAWWKAFRNVKTQMDDVARKKFGGCLSLR